MKLMCELGPSACDDLAPHHLRAIVCSSSALQLVHLLVFILMSHLVELVLLLRGLLAVIVSSRTWFSSLIDIIVCQLCRLVSLDLANSVCFGVISKFNLS